MTKHKLFGISLTMIGIILAGFVLVRSTLYAPDTELTPPNATSSLAAGVVTSPTSTPAVTQKTAPSVYPERLLIPEINVNAAVQYVGVKSNGAMANPSNFTDVAWYKNGAIPGNPGTAVFAGHVDNALALKGVFKRLGELRVGDTVEVRRKDGKILTFRVDALEYYPYKETPNRKVFTSSDGKAHLNLVTCAGTWIKSEKSYSERLVVYTTLLE
ncbi:class F sortase [Candidatus Parcubacteria bacterium]|nr:class F sortase [Candidatus Parcubacteria bacterium]